MPTYNATIAGGVLSGSTKNDTIYGNVGADELYGLDGKDDIYGGANNDTLYGGDNDDLLDGGSGNDVLSGGKGADTLIGGDGIDTVTFASATEGVAVIFYATDVNGLGQQYANKAAGGYSGEANGDRYSGFELFVGSAFRDLVGGASTSMTFNLGAGDDIFDTNQTLTVKDVVYGEAGNDTIWTGGGEDLAYGGLGADNLYGEDGNDFLNGGANADRIDGGAGSDTADYSDSSSAVTVSLVTGTGLGGDAQGDVLVGIEYLNGSAFNDALTGNAGYNVIYGNGGNDNLNGLAGNDVLSGGSGNDRIYGGAGADYIDGGDGTDTADYRYSTAGVNVSLLTNTGTGGEAQGDVLASIENLAGSNFNDVLVGNDGVNRLVGNQGSDTLYGMGGNDVFDTGGGYDTVYGGAGIDTVTYDDSWGAVVVNLATGTGSGAEAANDLYFGVENVVGSLFNDRLTGDANVNRLNGLAGNDVLDGGAGNDVLVGGLGADTLIGGAGDQDAASYQEASAGVIVNLVTGGTGGEAAGDTYSGIEYVYGSQFGDQIIGDGAINRLTGGGGNDWLDGAGGNDYLLGEAGNDRLTGGAGADVYIFGAGFGNDTVTDFWAGAGRTDRVWLQGTGLNTYADVLANAVNTAAGVLITAAGQGTLTLSGITLAQLNADDFLFG